MEKRVYLPEDIISQIITSSGLDLKSMIKWMGVSKRWRNLVSDHISNHCKGQFLVYDFHRSGRFGALDEETNQISWMCGEPHLKRLGRFMSSCDGLVCFLARDSYRHICICNPLTGECISIPGPQRRAVDIRQCSLGFCPTSNEYKLTCWISRTLETYTLGNPAGWRSRSVPFDFYQLCFPLRAAICVNGVFHWLLRAKSIVSFDLADEVLGTIQSILTFDLANEALGTIPPPRLEDGKQIYQLECMDHCLVVTVGSNPSSDLEIWVRKEDESSGESVWTKNWVIDATQPFHSGCPTLWLEPQKLSTDGRIIMRSFGDKLYSYDSIDKLVRCHWECDRGWGRSLYYCYYTPTFISPKKVMQEWTIMVKGREKRREIVV